MRFFQLIYLTPELHWNAWQCLLYLNPAPTIRMHNNSRFVASFESAFLESYTHNRFPASHFNRLLGIMSTCGAVVTLLQFPLFVWEAHHVDNALWVSPFDGMLALALLSPDSPDASGGDI